MFRDSYLFPLSSERSKGGGLIDAEIWSDFTLISSNLAHPLLLSNLAHLFFVVFS